MCGSHSFNHWGEEQTVLIRCLKIYLYNTIVQRAMKGVRVR
jgi:hypothetical protein